MADKGMDNASPSGPGQAGGPRRAGARQLGFFPLRWKVALSFSVLFVGMSLTVAMALVRYEKAFLLQEGEKRVRSLAENLAANARDPILASDELRLAPITASIMLDGDVRYAYVADHSRRVVSHSNTAAIGGYLADDASRKAPEIIESRVPIVVEGTQVGVAVVGLSQEFVSRALRSTAIGLLLPLAVGTVLGVLGIIWLTGVHVRRIEGLEAAVQALATGSVDVRAMVDSHDEVGRLAVSFNRMVRQIQDARNRLERNYTETVSALAAAVEAKDAYTRGHCERVARISGAIAQRMSMPSDALRELELAAILHDVGKIGVEGDILGKIGRLSQREVTDMRRHPEIGEKILNPLSSIGQVGQYVKHHHEHYDGTGYPAGLKEDEIPLASRIIALVDAYDAMITNRPYREALRREDALSRIALERGRQFDPGVVDAFLALHGEGVVDGIVRDVEQGR